MAVAVPQIAFANDVYDTSPTFTNLARCTGWTSTRGRSNELSRTETGTAQITLVDSLGSYDPTAIADVVPLLQARILATNPVTAETASQFRGYVESWQYTVDKTQSIVTVTINLVDIFGPLANSEVPVDSNSSGSVTYQAATVQDRLFAAAADANVPADFTHFFTGNVYVQAATYEGGQNELAVMQDASDAEFPGVANLYASKDGLITFHGRDARFFPANYSSYGIKTWHAGDRAAALGNAGWARINDIAWTIDDANLINACLCTPNGIPLTSVPGQLVRDAGSITRYGVRSQKWEGLQTLGGINDGLNALGETRLFSSYYVVNYAQPRPRITSLVFQSMDPGDPNNAETWKLMCGVEIGDLIIVSTTDPGGGGFRQAGFFVEHIENRVSLGNSSYPQWTQTLDVSPQGWFTVSPDGTLSQTVQPAPSSNLSALSRRFAGIR